MKPEIATLCQQHAAHIASIYPQTVTIPSLALCRKLRRLEVETRAHAVKRCNGEITDAQWDAVAADTYRKLRDLLGPQRIQTDPEYLYINADARGYALKLVDLPRDATLYRDMGGDGILAPDFSR